jgi:RNA polymerase sigma-70 factor (ECF subfamily)
MNTTPPSLLERIRRSPERDAWGRFVEMYTPLLVAWTRRLKLPDDEAADLMQDVFAVLVERLPSFQYDGQKSFRAWLKTVFLNRWRNVVRQRVAHKERGGANIENLQAADDFHELEAAEYRRFVTHRAFELMQAEFQPATWQACWQFVVLDRPAAQIASELGITVNAVYLAKSRVLRRLREELSGLLD